MSILAEAESLVYGDRGRDYGPNACSGTMSEPGAALTAPALEPTYCGGDLMGDGTPKRYRDHVAGAAAKIRFDESGCWTWIGSRDERGYGMWSFKGSISGRAHRALWGLIVGPIPEGLQLDHLCRNRACVNPDHLEPVTASVNVRRSTAAAAARRRAAQITHCPHGHPYDTENSYVDKRNKRVCRECNRQRARRNSAKKRAARV